MANRVALGVRSGSQIGLYVSKAGQNVLTASNNNLLFSSDLLAWQAVQTGTVNVPNEGFATITYPNLGYIPTVIALPRFTGYPPSMSGIDIVSSNFIWISNVSNTSSRINIILRIGDYSGQMIYCVLRIPANG